MEEEWREGREERRKNRGGREEKRERKGGEEGENRAGR